MDKTDYFFRAFFEHSADAMLVMDNDGKVTAANDAACQFFTATHEELLTTNYTLITADDNPAFNDLSQQVSARGSISLDLQLRHNKAERLSYNATVFKIDNEYGQQFGFIFKANAVTAPVESSPANEQSYQQIVQLAKEGIWVYDENNITTFASDALCRMLGYKQDEMLGRDIFCFIDESRRQQAQENLERRRNGVTEEFDFALLAKNGELIWTIVNTTPVIKGSQYAGAIAVITDVTARRQAEDEVVNREDRYRAMVENSYDAILLLDEQLRTVYRSPSTTSIMGFKDDERLGQSYLELTHPDDIEKLKGLQKTVISHPGKSIPITVRAKHSDGHYLWFMGVATNLLHEKNVQGIVVNLRDISERKKAEDDLKRLSNRLQLATQAANVCISDWDIVHNHVMYDECMFAMYKIKPEDFENTYESWVKCIHADDRERINREINAALKNKHEVKMKFRMVLPDGEIRHVVATSIIERDVNGHPIRMVATNRDVTKQVIGAKEREKLIAELIERNKALEQFAYIVSHNLRAPVANLVSLTDMITDADLDEADYAEVTAGLSKSVTKIDQIITDLNEIFQSKQHLYDHKEVVELQTLINDIRFSISDLMVRERVTLNSSFSQTCRIYTTRLYLYSILYNLILNAIKYRKPDVPPVINVTGSHQDGLLTITIADNGRGIDLKRHGDKLFGLYKRFDNTVEGRGIGLYMVKTQVEALGGHVKVDSQAGKGSQFSIAIPTSD